MIEAPVQPVSPQPDTPQSEPSQPVIEQPDQQYHRTQFFAPLRPSIVARIMGRKVTIYIGMDYQLWRWLSIEEIRREGLDAVPGQYTVAHSGEAVSWLRAHCPRSSELDDMVELYAGKVTNYWDYLRQWRAANQKEEVDDIDTEKLP